jgi:Zn-dependent peptidase ImmA (M78 family)
MSNYIDVIKKRQTSAPVNVIALANDLGVRVWTSKSLEDNVSGKLFRDEKLAGDSGYAILVNGHHAEVRQRFTIAHEIAHFVLHKDMVGNGIVDNTFYRSGLSNLQEVEANKLAAEILMPYSLIKEVCETNLISASDAGNLAKKFNVSETAMSIRLGISY